MNQPSPLEPGILVRSFFVVALHYAALLFGLLLSIQLISWLAFPEVFHLWNLPPEGRQPFLDAWENNPGILFPPGMCWGLIGAAAVLSLLTGLLVGWWAPFAGMRHGAFLAILLIVTFLQLALTQPQLPKWMVMGFLVVSPTAVVAGSRVGAGWREKRAGKRDKSGE